MRNYTDMFRPVYEQGAMIAWFFSALALLWYRPPMWYAFICLSLVMCAWRARAVFNLYRFRASLSALRAEKISMREVIAICARHLSADNPALWLGRGFDWSQRHAEIARQITHRDPKEIDLLPAWMPARIRKYFMPADSVPLEKDAIGAPWIHGINPKEEELRFPLEAVEGHTLIAGTTGAGKTRLFQLLATSIVRNGDVLIIMDPKNDVQLKEYVEQLCALHGRKFLYFNPAFPSQSIRLNLMANWHTLTEPASRLGQLVDADGSFQSFAWKTLYRIFRGMVSDGTMPNIRDGKRYVQSGVEPLLESILGKKLFAVFGPGWKQDLLTQYKPARGQSSQIRSETLACMINKYEAFRLTDEAIDALIAMANHSKEHYSKMIQVLEPLLEMLGSDELGAMLSPDALDLNDKRPIYNTLDVIEGGHVLYMGLNSLPNRTISSAIASLALSDFASAAGHIYNFLGKRSVYMLVDEAGEAMNDMGIQILNKGRGAGFKVFLALQTIFDMDVALNARAKALQVLGNLNNIISFRLQSSEMAEWVSDIFSKTSVRRISSSHSISSSSDNLAKFSGSTSQSISEEETPLVTPGLLMKLPGLNFIASLAGNRVLKGRIPLILD